jgi:hypothetical protein
MGRDRGRNEDNLLELKCFADFFRTSEVTQMDGVEGASKQPNPFLSWLRLYSFYLVLLFLLLGKIPNPKFQPPPSPFPSPPRGEGRDEGFRVSVIEILAIVCNLVLVIWCFYFRTCPSP